MKKIYLLKFLLFSIFALAQTKLFVGDKGKFRVSPGTLVYTGGGVKMVGSGQIDNSGNFYIKGTSADEFSTVDVANNAKTSGGNFILRLNDPTNYTTSTYGQLYITGLPQNKITGIVDKHYKTTKHGTYQQMALPFFEKTFHSLGLELISSPPAPVGTTFSNVRYSKNEVLRYDNTSVVSLNVDVSAINTAPAAYYQVGTASFDPSTTLSSLKGRPYSDQVSEFLTGIPLTGAGAGVNFGSVGQAKNQYKEPYNTYIFDTFDYTTMTTDEWTGNFGKNIYQFGNPFLINLDLSNIAYTDTDLKNNIQAIRYEMGQITSDAVGTFSGIYKYVTFTAGGPDAVAAGDINLVIKPMETFVIKMKSNTAAPKLFFNSLRSFNSKHRTAGNLSPTASAYSNGLNKIASSTVGTSAISGEVWQLGVIALDADDNEVGRTYFVVYPTAKTGFTTETSTQIAAQNDHLIGTFEELVEGGYDPVAAENYWLYINEANATTFKGKELPMYLYDENKIIKSLKFEILENAQQIQDGRSSLSNGESFYIKDVLANNLTKVSNGATIAVSADEFGLYYGLPQGTLDVKDNHKPNPTRVVFDVEEKNYKVIFAPGWRAADIFVYDLSGRLLSEEKGVNAKNIHTLNIKASPHSTYVVKLVSENGEVVTKKIIK